MFEVTAIPAFQDNYIWSLHDDRHAAIVDPGDAQPVFDYLERTGLELAAILITHHHADHIGGLASLLKRFAVPVCGPRDERIAGLSRIVREGDTVSVPELGASFSVLEVPGHTRSHIAYYGASSLFCGDTLFACGCGRLFEGTPEQMVTSLAKLSALPDDTRVYCAHEYTLANIRFARAVEPNNAALVEREAKDSRTRQQKQPTVPSTIGIEKATNPFLRYREPEVSASARQHAGAGLKNPEQVFAAIREWKNNF